MEMTAVQKETEKQYLERVKLEEQIVEKMRSKLTVKNAAIYTEKITEKLAVRIKELEATVALVENEISSNTLETTNTLNRIKQLEKDQKDLNKEIEEKNAILTRSMNEMTKRKAVIERKQTTIDQLQKKVEQMLQETGGLEIGPLEIQANSLQKSIDGVDKESTLLQKLWLKEQTELVKITKYRTTESEDVDVLKKKLTILFQKKLRIENEIRQQENEMRDIERATRSLQNDMIKLNTLIHKESGLQNSLQQENVLIENDFIKALKEAELETIQLKNYLEVTSEEKERLLNSLIEAERQIMLWEKKAQLAKEARQTVNSEIGQGEVHAMKAEIHRMEVRLSGLMKNQEKLIQDMEKSVSKRDTIAARGEAQAKTKNVVTKATFQKQQVELKKKIKRTLQEAGGCEQEIGQLQKVQDEITLQLDAKQSAIKNAQADLDHLDATIESLAWNKQKNLANILHKQQRSKNYQALKDGKYKMACKDSAAMETEKQKQMGRLEQLEQIVTKVEDMYPQIQPQSRKLVASLTLS